MGFNLKRGDLIKFKFDSREPWTNASVSSRAVKKGKKKHGLNWFNIKNTLTSERSCVNLDAVHIWKKVKQRPLQLTETDGLRDFIIKEWVNLGSPIGFSGVSKIYNHLKNKVREQVWLNF